jgi:hypothetical protein
MSGLAMEFHAAPWLAPPCQANPARKNVHKKQHADLIQGKILAIDSPEIQDADVVPPYARHHRRQFRLAAGEPPR